MESWNWRFEFSRSKMTDGKNRLITFSKESKQKQTGKKVRIKKVNKKSEIDLREIPWNLVTVFVRFVREIHRFKKVVKAVMARTCLWTMGHHWQSKTLSTVFLVFQVSLGDYLVAELALISPFALVLNGCVLDDVLLAKKAKATDLAVVFAHRHGVLRVVVNGAVKPVVKGVLETNVAASTSCKIT